MIVSFTSQQFPLAYSSQNAFVANDFSESLFNRTYRLRTMGTELLGRVVIVASFPSPYKALSFPISCSPSVPLASYKLHPTSWSGYDSIPPLSSSPSLLSSSAPPLSLPSFSRSRRSFVGGWTVWIFLPQDRAGHKNPV